MEVVSNRIVHESLFRLRFRSGLPLEYHIVIPPAWKERRSSGGVGSIIYENTSICLEGVLVMADSGAIKYARYLVVAINKNLLGVVKKS